MNIFILITMKDACLRALDEWRSNLTRTATEKNWRKLWVSLDEAYTAIHICGEVTNEFSYEMLLSHIYIQLAKLMFGYLYTDFALYGEYLIRVFKPTEHKAPLEILEEIHKKVNDKNDVTVDEIKKYVLRLLASIINFIYTPY